MEQGHIEQQSVAGENLEKSTPPFIMSEQGIVTSFGEMTPEEIVDTFVNNAPNGFKRFRFQEEEGMEGRWREAVSLAHARRMDRLEAEFSGSERMKQTMGGLRKVVSAPIVAAIGALSVWGAGHGLAHAASQGTIGFKKILSGITGKPFDEQDNSKWYNRVANKGV